MDVLTLTNTYTPTTNNKKKTDKFVGACQTDYYHRKTGGTLLYTP